MLSVIIPAYRATKFIDECIASLGNDVEILVGVDCCKETFNHLKDRSDIRLFYFTKNVGPFVIKNKLVDEATHENILFFDADDVMVEGAVQTIESTLKNVDYVKLSYINFYVKKDPKGHKMNDTVIAIKRNVFNSLNGFQPWRCGADTEFTKRLEYNNIKSGTVGDVCYFRRLHGDNLTMAKETGYKSPIRLEYMRYIAICERSKQWPNPETKITQDYVTYRNAQERAHP